MEKEVVNEQRSRSIVMLGKRLRAGPRLQITVITFLTVPPTLRRSVPSAVADLTGEITLVRRPVPLLAPKAISMEAVSISSNSCHKEQLYPPLLGIKSQCICDCWHKAQFNLRTIAFQANYRPATVHKNL